MKRVKSQSHEPAHALLSRARSNRRSLGHQPPSRGVTGIRIPEGGACALILLLALTFGGGTRQGLLSDALVQLVSVPVLAVALWKIGEFELLSQVRGALLVLGAVVLLPLVQIIPMPMGFWTLLPGRAEIAAAYRARRQGHHCCPW